MGVRLAGTVVGIVVACGAVAQDRPTPEAFRQRLATLLGQPALTEAEESELRDHLGDHADRPQVIAQVRDALAPGRPTALRRALMRLLTPLPIAPLPRPWDEALAGALDDPDPGAAHEALCTIRQREILVPVPSLERAARRTDLTPAARLTALACLTARQRQMPPERFAELLRHLDGGQPLEAFTAARALGTARLDGDQWPQLADKLATVPPLLGQALLPAFRRSREEDVGLLLVRALDRSPTGASLTPGDLDRLLADFPASVGKAAGPLRAAAAGRGKAARERLAESIAAVPPGDSVRGKAVFHSPRAGCTDCHRTEGPGGGVGPNLARIGFVRSEGELLEALLLPSAYVAPEFRTYVVEDAGGRLTMGLWARETAEAVYLLAARRSERRIARAAVVAIAPSAASLMPEGYAKLLTPQEIGDLVAYLGRLR